ncbi:hypothetical protein BA895_19935 [Humibacillus sp. DSM 29435]|uniref:tubulin-like doman-containing protein n=1 Tax=Humibacillus sp. DSM 29435 TaxID=1869167 RepID=UPI0008727856|nr:tubulin-like doman-containing protein [Humibacillus sp. DSM 29435]OFE16162.1 hypothetical protein BA895_19935 [Humibacillus sp. DSM 29435]
MRKFLVVGCGGSGGKTLRLLIDQIRADFRANPSLRGADLPAAWQFVHIDVPVDPDREPTRLGSIRDLGGTYVSFSSPQNTYEATSLNVESQLRSRSLAPLVGWAPKDRPAANTVPVTSGAGQYRAIGRMLTLPRLAALRTTLLEAQSKIVGPTAWGSIPTSEQGSDVIIPIVVASMAGGSGASMFLDVCRLLGTLPGINAANIGCLLYTADVFGELPDGRRANVEGNAMAAISEVIAAVSGLSDEADKELLGALGLPTFMGDEPAFARVIPIGRRIGGAGAFFGDGTADGVYRGVARALAGIMTSERASQQYLDSFLGNPTPMPTDQELFGWKIGDAQLPFGSLGFASLSLGRDRYLDYAAQRLSRAAVDHLRSGHLSPTSQLPSLDQLRLLMDNQWGASMQHMGLPQLGQPALVWFQSVAYPSGALQAAAGEAAAQAATTMANTGAAPAAAWLATAQAAVGMARPQVVAQIQRFAYSWAEGWAGTLEGAAKAEFVRATSDFGLPYARELMTRVARQCDALIDELSSAGQTADATDPLAVDTSLVIQATALGKQVVNGAHALGQTFTGSLNRSCEDRLRREAARYAAAVLRSYVSEVLRGLQGTANESLKILEAEVSRTAAGAGLAQLHSVTYGDWPDESEKVPARFDHAQNEVLLTTSSDFPRQFRDDVTAAHRALTYPEGLAAIRSEIIGGQWQTAGPVVTHTVLEQRGHWRAPVLNRSALDGQPTPQATPSYRLEMTAAGLIARAQDRLSARGDVFERFAGQSIAQYLGDPAVSDFDREQRQQDFARRFIETMALARPVVGVDAAMVPRIHSNRSVRYVYSFSEIPFEENDEVARAVRQRLAGDADLEPSTVDNFGRALAGSDATTGKISLFGSYEKVSPLCYSSLLDPIKNRWATADASYQRSLWLWKRARPLHASLAMSPDEAVRIAAGWYLGRLLGLVRQTDPRAPEVRAPEGWLAFGPLLESREVAAQGPMDFLASVLMSHSWALARCSGDPHLTPLAPYAALRRLMDTSGSTQMPPQVRDLAGTQLLAQALWGRQLTLKNARPGGGDAPLQGDAFAGILAEAEGRSSLAANPTPQVGGAVSGQPVGLAWEQRPTPQAQAAPPSPVESKAKAVSDWIESLRAWYRSTGYVQAAPGWALTIHTRDQLQSAPLSIELAPLAFKAFDLLDACLAAALEGPFHDPMGSGGAKPLMEGPDFV